MKQLDLLRSPLRLPGEFSATRLSSAPTEGDKGLFSLSLSLKSEGFGPRLVARDPPASRAGRAASGQRVVPDTFREG